MEDRKKVENEKRREEMTEYIKKDVTCWMYQCDLSQPPKGK